MPLDDRAGLFLHLPLRVPAGTAEIREVRGTLAFFRVTRETVFRLKPPREDNRPREEEIHEQDDVRLAVNRGRDPITLRVTGDMPLADLPVERLNARRLLGWMTARLAKRGIAFHDGGMMRSSLFDGSTHLDEARRRFVFNASVYPAGDGDRRKADAPLALAIPTAVDWIEVPFVLAPAALPPDPRLPYDAPAGPRGAPFVDDYTLRTALRLSPRVTRRAGGLPAASLADGDAVEGDQFATLSWDAALPGRRPPPIPQPLTIRVRARTDAGEEIIVDRALTAGMGARGDRPFFSFRYDGPARPADRFAEFAVTVADVEFPGGDGRTVELPLDAKGQPAQAAHATGVRLFRPAEATFNHLFELHIPLALLPHRDRRWCQAIGVEVVGVDDGRATLSPRRPPPGEADDPEAARYFVHLWGLREDAPPTALRLTLPIGGAVTDVTSTFRDVAFPRRPPAASPAAEVGEK